VKAVIKYLNPKKSSDYDLITNQILQKLPEMGIKYITQLYAFLNALELLSIPMETCRNYYDLEA